MAFRKYKDFQANQQGMDKLIGTDSEAFVLGEILTLAAGLLTKGGVDTTGTQKYICHNAFTGDGASADGFVHRLREDEQYKVESPGAVVVGTAYTLSTAATGITTTTTNGVFEVDEELTENGIDYVVGHFVNTSVI